MTKSFRQTKIVATLGPASVHRVRELADAGVNLFRLNFSHGDHATHQNTYNTIRSVEEEIGRPLGVMADMQGPKLRVGEFKDGAIDLEIGQTFRFDMDKTPGDNTRVCLPHPEILGVLDVGNLIYMDDGNVRAEITAKGKDYVEAKILAGSHLSNRKGVNIPDAVIPVPALTEKDRKDLAFALDLGVDWIAQSFVQTPEDVQQAQELMKDEHGNPRSALLVKIEKPSALEHIDEIIALADGVMLARGDLGVEIPPENVPAVQKSIIRKVRNLGKPIIVATQMLESMVHNARPTRAEASDVATAVYDGADAVMLSAETAAGEYPIEAVTIMDKICRRIEADDTYYELMDIDHPDAEESSSDAITTAAYYIAETVEAKAIVTYTESGSTSLRMARQRPAEPIMCLTPNKHVARRLVVSYGIRPVHCTESVENFEGPAMMAAKYIIEEGLGTKGDRFVMTAGVPFGTPGTTNTLRIEKIK